MQIKKYQKRNSVLKLLGLNFLYCLVLSIVLGFFISLIAVSASNNFNMEIDIINNYYKFLLSTSGFVFICLTSILLLNIESKSYINLPKVLLLAIVITSIIKPIRPFKKSIIHVVIITLLLELASLSIISSLNVQKNLAEFLVLISIIVSFLIAVFLYTESSIPPILRSIRQFSLYFLMFLGFLYLNFCQLFFMFSSDNLDSQTAISVGVLVFGLVFSLATVLDKSRVMFNEIFSNYKGAILSKWKQLSLEYSIKHYINIVNNLKKEYIQSINMGKKMWSEGKQIKLLKAIVFLILFFTFGLLLIVNSGVIQKPLTVFVNFLVNQWYLLFQGNEYIAKNFFILILITFGIVWFSAQLIIGIKRFRLKEIIRYVVIITFMFLLDSMVLVILYSDSSKIITYYIIFPLFLLFVIFMIVFRFIK